jgi:hypothetical protein
MSSPVSFLAVVHCLRPLSLVAVDLIRLVALAARPRAALVAENLFLRKQLALFQERKVRPRRADASTRWMIVPIGNTELHENMELVCHPSVSSFGCRRSPPVGRRRVSNRQIPSRPPGGEPRASAPTRRPASFGQKAEAGRPGSAPVGVAVRSLARLAIRSCDRQACNRHLWLSQTPYAGKLPVQVRPSWFGSKQQGCVGPGLVSLLESIVWLECENEVEILP